MLGLYKTQKMSFEDKLNHYFSSFTIKLSGKPAQHLKHIYADYIELISLFSNQNYVSASDIEDRFRDESIISQRKSDSEQAEANDGTEGWIDSLYLELNNRNELYGDFYPYEFLGIKRIRLKESSQLTNENKLYLFLLIASSLNVFDQFEPEITTEFETVCYRALSEFLPKHAIVKPFGKNTSFSGSALEKIRILATQLKVEVDESYLSKISTRGNMERGLDLIGWIPFSDSIGNHLSLLCQCACGKEWYRKLTETRRYEKYYRFYNNKPNHVMFIPYALIDYQESNFHQADEISVDTLVFERKRIINYITDFTFFDSLKSKKVVDQCILSEEDIV